MTKAFNLSALGLIAGMALATAAQAQPAAAPAAPAAAAADAASAYSDDQVKRFAGALGQLQKVNAEFAPKIAAATGDAKAVAERDMAIKMHETLQTAGLTPEEYSKMATAMKADEQLNARVSEQLAAAPQSSAAPASQ
jgi:hypothetical protein